MSHHVGTGTSTLGSSREAAAAAARAALETSGAKHLDFALAVVTSKHDPAEVTAGMREVLGPDTRILGLGSHGIITNDLVSYGSHVLGVLGVAGDGAKVEVTVEGGLDAGEHEVGKRLGRKLAAAAPPEAMLILYDAVKRAAGPGGPPLSNYAAPLIDGLESELGRWPSAAGLGMMFNNFERAPLWLDDERLPQSAAVVSLSGALKMRTAVLQGARPVGDYYTVTRAEGPAVLELDGRPALDVMEEALGPDAAKTMPFFTAFGVNRGDKFGEFRQEDYASHFVMGADPQTRALVMFDCALRPGLEVQLMRRHLDLKEVAGCAQNLRAAAEAEGEVPYFALFIECVGRIKSLAMTDHDDAEEVQRVLSPDIPLFGLYSGCEIGQVHGAVTPMNSAGVLCLFVRR